MRSQLPLYLDCPIGVLLREEINSDLNRRCAQADRRVVADRERISAREGSHCRRQLITSIAIELNRVETNISNTSNISNDLLTNHLQLIQISLNLF